jgi:hypothetical protein
MSIRTLRKLWLALLLLVCSLASAPLGSMEQAGAALSGGSAHAQTLPVARSAAEAMPAVADAPRPSAPTPPGDAPHAGIDVFPPSAQRPSLHGHLPPTAWDLPRLLDRLPYRATAPPRAAPPTIA